MKAIWIKDYKTDGWLIELDCQAVSVHFVSSGNNTNKRTLDFKIEGFENINHKFFWTLSGLIDSMN